MVREGEESEGDRRGGEGRGKLGPLSQLPGSAPGHEAEATISAYRPRRQQGLNIPVGQGHIFSIEVEARTTAVANGRPQHT